MLQLGELFACLMYPATMLQLGELFACLMYPDTLSKDFLSMTADVKLSASVAEPILRPFWISTRPSLICGQRDSGAYTLEQAEHFCPEYSKADRMVEATTVSTSAVGWTK